jgi:hypothetical protein
MLFDAGSLTLCTLENGSLPGEMPVMQLKKQSSRFYGERTVGYSRQYAAFGVNQQIDLLVRIWQDRSAKIGMYVLLEDGSQYRIDNVQHLVDESGLKVTDLTLFQLEKYYDVATEAKTDE